MINVELDDLVNAGVFGLMDALDASDPTRGVKTETYCSPRTIGKQNSHHSGLLRLLFG